MGSRERSHNDYNVVLIVLDTLRKDAVGCYENAPDWGPDFPPIRTPYLDAFAAEAVRFTRAYPEVLPTLPARRSLYTGNRTFPFHNANFRLRGDFPTAPGWGPIPEDQDTLAEILSFAGFRTGLVSDLYHQFKPSKNFWRGFDEWRFIRGQETDPSRSGPAITEAELDRWVPRELRELRFSSDQVFGRFRDGPTEWFSRTILLNMRDRVRDEQWFNAQVMRQAAEWLEQNSDARSTGERLFLTVECFDPHEPWFVPPHYREPYDADDGQEQVISLYTEYPELSDRLLRRTRANYAGLVTMVDRSLGGFFDYLRRGGWLSDTIVIVASDHGHSLHERRNYMGKRGYPSEPEVFDVPLLIRHPDATGGRVCDAWTQHHDVAATILEATGVTPETPVDGRSVLEPALRGGPGARSDVVIGWGPAVTVVDDEFWFNCKVNGKGALLRRRNADGTLSGNVAGEQPDVVGRMFETALTAAGHDIPPYLMDLAEAEDDAPGCSPFAAIPLGRG